MHSNTPLSYILLQRGRYVLPFIGANIDQLNLLIFSGRIFIINWFSKKHLCIISERIPWLGENLRAKFLLVSYTSQKSYVKTHLNCKVTKGKDCWRNYFCPSGQITHSIFCIVSVLIIEINWHYILYFSVIHSIKVDLSQNVHPQSA